MKKKSNEIGHFWLNLWNLLTPSRKDFKKIIGFVVIFEMTALVGPYLLKLIIDNLMMFDAENVGLIVMLIGLMFLSEQIKSIIDYWSDKFIFRMLIDMEYYLPVSAQKKLTELSLSYHEKENTGGKLAKIEKGVNKVVDFMANLSWEVIPTFLQLAITLIVLFFIEWKFGVAMLLFAPAFVWLTFWVNKKVHPIRKKRYQANEKSYGVMTGALMNINTVKSFVQEKKETEKFAQMRKSIQINEGKEWGHVLRVGLGRNLIIDLGRSSTLLLGVYLVLHGQISIGTLVFVITLSEKAYLSLFRLSRFYDKIEEGRVAVERFIRLLSEKVVIKNSVNAFSPEKVIGRVEFRDVDFSYNGDTIKALSNVNLTINSGCVTALVGTSGSGKTTLARMIYRHYDPTRGAVLLDGKDLRELDLYGFRKFMAIVPQEVEVFDLTVAENISYAKPGASMEEVRAVARMANAHEFIEKLVDGYDTQVGERGVKLSGGQRQRLGIARALLVNPRVLIFDEATSALDSVSEKLIQDAMTKITDGRTTIIIAHRLSTIKNADKIVVLEDGEIVEEGAHIELANKRGGAYKRLLKLQEIGSISE